MLSGENNPHCQINVTVFLVSETKHIEKMQLFTIKIQYLVCVFALLFAKYRLIQNTLHSLIPFYQVRNVLGNKDWSSQLHRTVEIRIGLELG